MARILVIDNEDIVLELLGDILSMGGHETVVASDGEAGIALYDAERIDLVITDIIMPDKDGLDVIKELRKDHPQVKIIASAASGDELLSLAMDAGANRSLEKPFALNKVLELVEELLGETP